MFVLLAISEIKENINKELGVCDFIIPRIDVNQSNDRMKYSCQKRNIE